MLPNNSNFLRFDRSATVRPVGRSVGRPLVWAFVAMIIMLFVVPNDGLAADLPLTRAHAKQHKHIKRLAYFGGCRTGWWQAYCNGDRRPRWGMRCT